MLGSKYLKLRANWLLFSKSSCGFLLSYTVTTLMVSSDEKLSVTLQKALAHIADTIDVPLTVHLWDGTKIPLGSSAREYSLTIKDKGVIASLIKHPNIENVVRHYAVGNISLDGGDLVTMGEKIREKLKKKDIKRLSKKQILKSLLPFLLTSSLKPELNHSFDNDETGMDQSERDNKNYIQFHYDVSNDFYKLFLDPEMQYSCAYFHDWEQSIEQAQKNKLDMICKKLRLKEGESLLDIGCGWGGLVCHAVQHYGVKAHGVTLSQKQYDFATEKVKRLGLQDKITLEIRDYITLEGTYDKISSIGMFEHIGP